MESQTNSAKSGGEKTAKKRYVVSCDCYIEGVYHKKGEEITLSDESLKAPYMKEIK